MPAWREIQNAEPEFAAQVQRVFDAHLHKTMATLRLDGGPRISGTEATFKDGELWLGMLATSRKAQDLARDGRVALHSATVDAEMSEGDAKLSAVAVRETDAAKLAAAFGEAEDGSIFFRLDIHEVALTQPSDSAGLAVSSWNATRGLRALVGG
ncbi:MAG: pyridoxamine 5-phosphate oxidase [Chloroflexi bacterium]|nr:pyridoxamine 5-phosphate oxidase [Chloroflexota bacterium]MDA1147229.1 pyridoxamine 5-phosphate oxidase [Chloroflexota bacterium]